MAAGIVIAMAFLGFNIGAARTEASTRATPEPLRSTPAASTMPTQPRNPPGPAPSPALPGGYEYQNTVNGSPALANACVPVILDLDISNAPTGGSNIVNHAIERAATMTGLDLVATGTNTDSTRIEITFQSETQDPDLAGNAIGVARTRSATSEAGTHIINATIRLETEWFTTAVTAAPDLATMVVLHELGHALGLDHVSDPTSIMYPSAKASTPSNTDNQAFAALNAGCAIMALNDSQAR